MKPQGGQVDEQAKGGASSDRRATGFGAPSPLASAPAGFGRRKTPIPESTDGTPPREAANDRSPRLAAFGARAPVSLPAADAAAPDGRAAAVASDDVSEELLRWLRGELRRGREIHHESVLCALGALAGYAAQQAIREALVKSGKLALDQAFVVIETRSGEVFFFGDLLNEVIVAKDGGQSTGRDRGHASIWKIVSDAGYEAGAINLPDVSEIIKHCAATVGGQEFGIPRVADAHQPALLPREAVSRFWPAARRTLAKSDPMSWPLHLAMAAGRLIVELKDAIRPDIAVGIVMEAAVPMSKIDPVTLPKE